MSVSVVYMKDFTKGKRGIKYSGPRERLGEIVIFANATTEDCDIKFVRAPRRRGMLVKSKQAVLLSSEGLPPVITLKFDPTVSAIPEPIPFPPGPGGPKPDH